MIFIFLALSRFLLFALLLLLVLWRLTLLLRLVLLSLFVFTELLWRFFRGRCWRSCLEATARQTHKVHLIWVSAIIVCELDALVHAAKFCTKYVRLLLKTFEQVGVRIVMANVLKRLHHRCRHCPAWSTIDGDIQRGLVVAATTVTESGWFRSDAAGPAKRRYEVRDIIHHR